MTNAFIGQISMFGGNYPPRNFALCNGQVMQIAQNTALFSLIGTTYGGNGTTTFALPNLQSQLPIHQGQGQGLSSYTLGQAGGAPNVTIDITTMPTHIHTLEATTALATTGTINSGAIPAQATGDSVPLLYAANQTGLPPLVPHPMDKNACTNTGGSQAHSNLMPSQCISFIIALQGIYPSRN